METKKIFAVIGTLLISVIALAASTFANYTNYNSNNTAGLAPQIDAFNMYQIDGEAADPGGFTGTAGYITVGTFQEWNSDTWPYEMDFPGDNVNGVEIPPGSSATWILSAGDFPEVKWGVFRVHLVLVTTTGAGDWGPAAPVDIIMEVDSIGQVETTVWSAINGQNQFSVWNDIWIDFHLNVGQKGEDTWLGQPWCNIDHSIIIANSGEYNTLWIDEFHLTTAT